MIETRTPEEIQDRLAELRKIVDGGVDTSSLPRNPVQASIEALAWALRERN